jgi:predicted GNAT family acetyltransferase
MRVTRFSDPNVFLARAGSLFLWEHERPVSMAGWAGRTEWGGRVNFVYTPPEHRYNGYATACVAALTRRLLDEGQTFCCLFADLSNPTANAIYQRIGYRAVCDLSDYILSARKDT